MKYAPKPVCYLLKQFLDEIHFTFPEVHTTMIRKRPPWISSGINIDLSLNDLPKKETNAIIYQAYFSEIHNQYDTYTHIFTDGSRTKIGAGCAVKINETILHSRLNDYCSIFYCEAFAILRALKYIKEQPEEKFIIFTDSKSVLLSIKNVNNQEPIINEIANLYDDLSQNNKEIIFIWIPSHRGITGNMLVDKAAKDSINSHISELPISHNDVKKELHRKVKDLWNTEWTSSPSKLLQIKRSIFEDYPPYLHRRKDQTILTRLRIGHSKLTHHHLLTKETPNECEQCNTILTIPHILLDCPIYIDERKKCSLPHTLSEALNNKASVEKVLMFLNKIDIMNQL